MRDIHCVLFGGGFPIESGIGGRKADQMNSAFRQMEYMRSNQITAHNNVEDFSKVRYGKI
jgi:hypothetical protein